MNYHYSGYDHQEKMWIAWMEKPDGTIRIQKKSKKNADIKKWNKSKKYKDEIGEFKKSEHLADNIIEERKAQTKIQTAIKKPTLDNLAEAEKLSRKYKYKKDEIKKVIKKKKLKSKPTTKKTISASAFYHPNSQGGIFAMKKKNYEILNYMGKKLKKEGYKRIEIELKNDEDEKYTIIVDEKLLSLEPDSMKLALGKKFAEQEMDEPFSGNVKMKIKGLL